MLQKSKRLTTAQVAEVLKHGKSRRATYLSAKFLTTKAPLRAAAVVSKKVARGAVERNRLRRAVYRALSSPAGKEATSALQGDVVLFVQKVPQENLTALFSKDVAVLCKNGML